MLIQNLTAIGNNLYLMRKRLGMTQAEVAEASGLSERTYADIERGSANMRIISFLRICQTLGVTPDRILTEESEELCNRKETALTRLASRSEKEQQTAMALLAVYLDSLE